MFEQYSKLLMKHPRAFVAVWVVALLVALPFAAQADDVLNYDMTSMGGFESESSEGQVIVDEHFEGSLSSGTILAIPYSDAEVLASIESGLIDSGALSDALGERFGDRVSYDVMGSFGESGSDAGVFIVAFGFSDGDAMEETGDLRAAVAEAKDAAGLVGIDSYVTGAGPIAYDTLAGANEDVKKVDPLSVLLIVLLLGLFFWTLVTAAVPPLAVGTAYGVVLALMFAIGSFMDVFYITKTIVLVSMLGAGVDYSVFIISRYKEERKEGRGKEEALAEAVKWAGESVLTSGLAVIIGFAVMSLCSYSLVSSMAVVLALGIVVAMLAALTLIPALVAILGDRVFWPRTIEDYTRGSRMRGGVYGRMVDWSGRYFSRAGRFSIRHAKAIVAVAILLTVPAAYVASTSDDSFDMISVMPDSEAKEGVEVITGATDGGIVMPTYALVQLEYPIAYVQSITEGVGVLTWSPYAPEYLAGLDGLSSAIVDADGNVSYTFGPTSWESVYSMGRAAIVAAGMPESMVTAEMVNRAVVGQMPDAVASGLTSLFDTVGWDTAPSDAMAIAPGVSVPVSGLIDYAVNVGTGLVSSDGRYVQVMVVVGDEPMSQTSMDSVQSARDVLSAYASENSWIAGTWVVGTPAVLSDISDVVNDEFHWIELGVIVLIYLLLLAVLGVYLTPLRSLATILMSVVWTLAALQLVFSMALGAEIVWIVPIVLFVICLGLGMDYDILVTTRIREGKHRGMTNDEAIENALYRSGPIITLCGLIMGGTFLTLLVSGSVMLREIGFALGFAILVDALVVVPYVVPAMMHLMGNWSWKGPRFLARRRSLKS